MKIWKILTEYLLPEKVGPIEEVDPQETKILREAFRQLGVLKTVRGSGRSLVIEVDPNMARALSAALAEIADKAELNQKAVKDRIRQLQNM